MTDADLILGRLEAGSLARGEVDLDLSKAKAAVGKIAEQLEVSTEVAAHSIAEAVEDSLAIAAQAHAAEHGLDLPKHVLVAFGGAAPLRATYLAERLGIETVLVPPDASVGSAMGFFSAPLAFEALESCRMKLTDFNHEKINAIFRQLWHKTVAVVAAGAARWKPGRPPKERRRAYMRYVGQGHEVCVDLPNRDLEPEDTKALLTEFELVYTQLGHIVLEEEAEFRAFALEVVADADPLAWPQERLRTKQNLSSKSILHFPSREGSSAQAYGKRLIYDGQEVEYLVYSRSGLQVGELVHGPAVITEAYTTTIVSESFDCWLLENGFLQLQARDAKRENIQHHASLRPQKLLGFSKEGWEQGQRDTMSHMAHRLAWTRLLTIVEEQAQAVLKAAFAPLLRESRAVLCAVFNGEDLIAQSEMSSPSLAAVLLHNIDMCVREGALQRLSPDECIVRINPGSMPNHSDLVVVTPVFEPPVFSRPSGLIASAAHTGQALVSSCVIKRENACKLGTSAKDVVALVAANELGHQRLTALLAERGVTLSNLGTYICSESRQAVQRNLRRIPPGVVAEQKRSIRIQEIPTNTIHRVELGAQVQVDDTCLDVKLLVDCPVDSSDSEPFRGSPAFMCTSFSKYACIAALGQDVPVNKGSLSVFRIGTPSNTILDASPEGNNAGKTSQVAEFLPDLILHCMSSFGLFLRSADSASFLPSLRWTCGEASGLHFEGGGMGAQSDRDGLSSTIFPCGFQSIPLEIAEMSDVFLFNCKELITDSGGAGRFRGGLGVRWELIARQKTHAAAIQGSDPSGPLGREGGCAGRPFFMQIKRKQARTDGTDRDSECEKGDTELGCPPMSPGDVLLLETPGGGGYGPPAKRSRESLLHDLEDGYISAAAVQTYESKEELQVFFWNVYSYYCILVLLYIYIVFYYYIIMWRLSVAS